jgi:hypothetical protein
MHVTTVYVVVFIFIFGNRNSSVNIVTILRAGRAGGQISSAVRDFSVFHIVQTGLGSHLAPYSVGTGVLSRGDVISYNL